MIQMPRVLLLALAALLATLAGIALWLDRAADVPHLTIAPTAIEASAGAIYAAKFTDIDGNEQMLGQWHGKLLVINFWATWCAPCREEMPLLAKLQNEFAAKGLQVVGIAVDSRLNVANFNRESPTPYPLLPDEARAMAFAKRVGNPLGLLPYTLILNQSGDAIFTRLGVVTESEMRKLIANNLQK